MGGGIDPRGQPGLDATDVIGVDLSGRLVAEHKLKSRVLVPSLKQKMD
jgi:hypothetical protein